MAMKELYKTLKDHKNGFMQNLVQSSYQTIYQDEVQRFMNETDEIDLEECGGESVVRVIVVNQSFQPSLSSAISKMEDAKLQIDRFGFNETSVEITGDKKDQPERLSDKLTVLINDIGIAMKKLDYALHRHSQKFVTASGLHRGRIIKMAARANERVSSFYKDLNNVSNADLLKNRPAEIAKRVFSHRWIKKGKYCDFILNRFVDNCSMSSEMTKYNICLCSERTLYLSATVILFRKKSYSMKRLQFTCRFD